MNPGSVVDLITPGNPQPLDGRFSHNHNTRMIEPLSAEVGPNNSTPDPLLSTAWLLTYMVIGCKCKCMLMVQVQFGVAS